MVKGRHQKGYLNKHIEALDFLTKVEHINVLNGTSGKISHVLIKISLLCKKTILKIKFFGTIKFFRDYNFLKSYSDIYSAQSALFYPPGKKSALCQEVGK